MNARDKERLALLQIWKKAFTDGEASVNLPGRNEAIRFRFMLYGAAKLARQSPEIDPLAAKAAETCSVYLSPGPKPPTVTVIIQHRRVANSVLAAMEQLGIGEEDLKTPEERAAEESLRKLAEGLERPGNKYFSRKEDE